MVTISPFLDEEVSQLPGAGALLAAVARVLSFSLFVLGIGSQHATWQGHASLLPYSRVVIASIEHENMVDLLS